MTRFMVAVCAAIWLTGCGGSASAPSTDATKIGEALISDPAIGPGYAAIARAYPGVWRSFLDQAADEPQTDEGAARSLSFLEARLAPATPGLIIAPDRELGDFLRARIALLEALSAYDPASCASYFRFGETPPLASAPPPVRRALLAHRAAYFRALAAAVETPVERPPLTKEEERQALDVAHDVERESGVNGRVTKDSSVADQCRFGLGHYEIMARTSPTLGGRLFADEVVEGWEDQSRFPPGI